MSLDERRIITSPELEEETRLADPGVPDDPNHLTVPFCSESQPVPEDSQLIVAADERSEPCPRGEARIAAEEAPHGRRSLRPAGGSHLEAPLQVWSRLRAREDGVGRGPLDQVLEHGPCGALGVDIDGGRRSGITDQERAGMEGHRRFPGAAILHARPRHLLLDRQRGVSRAPRGVLRRLEPEDGHHGTRPEILNMVGVDAFIACHDTKYTYWVPRPTQVDPEIRLTIGLPNHPSYPSNQACLSGAIGLILDARFPDQGGRYFAMAREAGESRVYAGIHYRFDVDDGFVIARKVVARALQVGIPSDRPFVPLGR